MAGECNLGDARGNSKVLLLFLFLIWMMCTYCTYMYNTPMYVRGLSGKSPAIFILFFRKFYLFIFRKRGREGEREGEKYQCVVASCTFPLGDLAHIPGMCPDWELNQRPFGSLHSIHWATPARPSPAIFNILLEQLV